MTIMGRYLPAIVVGGGLLLMACGQMKNAPDQKRIEVIAHRGASAYAPENTLAAFELAFEKGADWFELDCTLSKDDAVIVIHDDDLERTTDLEGRVRDLTLAELKKADAGSWYDAKFAGERLPTLGEALDLAKGRIGVYIEIKDSDNDAALKAEILAIGKGSGPLLGTHENTVAEKIEGSGTRNFALTKRVIQTVRERDMIDEVVIQSFSPIVCAIALIEAPEIRTELLASSSAQRPQQWLTYLEWARRLNVKGFNVAKNDLTPELVAEFHSLGARLATWTVNDEAEMTRVATLGVDAIITDRPDVCREVLAELGK